MLPQVYLLGNYFLCFLFEFQIEYRLALYFYFSWLYIRYFMVSKLNPTQVGAPNVDFALFTFFPEATQDKIQKCSEVAFMLFNSTGFFDVVQNSIKYRLSNSNP